MSKEWPGKPPHVQNSRWMLDLGRPLFLWNGALWLQTSWLYKNIKLREFYTGKRGCFNKMYSTRCSCCYITVDQWFEIHYQLNAVKLSIYVHIQYCIVTVTRICNSDLFPLPRSTPRKFYFSTNFIAKYFRFMVRFREYLNSKACLIHNSVSRYLSVYKSNLA